MTPETATADAPRRPPRVQVAVDPADDGDVVWVHAPWEVPLPPRARDVWAALRDVTPVAPHAADLPLALALRTRGLTASPHREVQVPLVYGVLGVVERHVAVHGLDRDAGLAVVAVTSVDEAARAVLDALAAPPVRGLVLTVAGGRRRGPRAACFDDLVTWLDALLAPRRLALPPDGVTIVGW
ncbi:MAG: hypothetical protein H6733_09685 [Alphaproteobacteria bacterium]|nr:hypothetical protein [Alphaproteobacteria bacterium]